ncbi:MAG: family 16 glycosylhydrolase [Cytophagales bacterium]|nr:family 16 glycosylhydrolase [Cytophagales bacterium]
MKEVRLWQIKLVPWMAMLFFCLGVQKTFGQCVPGETGNVPGADYVLVWADEFDVDGAVCTDNWFHQTQIPTPGGWFNGEEQHYTDRTDNSFVAGGFLNIVAKRETFVDQGLSRDYTSARLNSKFAFTYGRVDVRARFDGGSGTWPAIWMLGRNVNEPGGFWHDQFGNVTWPACGEIDIMEHFGSQDAVIHGSIHTPSSSGATVNTGTVSNPDYASAFHDYTIIWDQDQIQFLVDDVPYYTYSPATQNSDTWVFDEPQYLLLNFAMGGIGGSIPAGFNEASMVVDYVRVYQKEFIPPAEPEVAAEAPIQPDANVISLFSDSYTDVAVDTWRTDWSDASFEDVNFAGTAMKKYSNLNFVGIETVSNQIDASNMTNFHFDMWTPDATQFRVKLVDFGADGAFGGGDDTEHELTYESPSIAQWNSYDIPLSDFTGLTSTGNIAQLIFAGMPAGAATAFIDNIYYYRDVIEPETAAPTPTQAAGDVISMFSDAYTDVPVDTWRTVWSDAIFEDVTLAGSAVKKYTNLSFVGIETVANPIDASAMENFHFDLWTPDAETFRVKWVDFGTDGAFGGGDDTEHEIAYENPDLGQWVSFDIPMSAFSGLGGRSALGQLILSGNPAGAFSAFIDNVYFYSGSVVTPEPVVAAPAPTQDAADVISMFSDNYTDVPVDTWRTDWSSAALEDVVIDGSAMKKYTNLSFVGIETVSNQIDASGMSHFHFDLWTPEAETFRVKWVDFGADGSFGGGDDTEHELTYENPAQSQWVSFEIPMSDFVNLGSTSNLAQLIFSGAPAGLFTAFVDNVYFYNESTGPEDAPTVAAAAPTQDAANVISLFSDSYTDVPVDTWRTSWSAADFEDVVIDGSAMKKYTNLTFVGIETVTNQIDASGMTNFRFDLWTPNATQFRVKLVDFGPDGAFGTGDETEYEITYESPTQGEWISFDIPLTDFAGLTNTTNIAQLIFAGMPDGAATAFIDNVYFYNGSTGSGDAPTVAAAAPTQDAANVISLFSDSYTDVPVDTWRTSWSAADFEDVVIDGSAMKKYTNLTFVGIETVTNQIDASGMTNFRFDLWTPNATQFRVKLVDFGPDGAFGTGDETEHEITYESPAQGEWISYDIPLTDFAGLTNTTNIAQLIFAGMPDGAATAFIDNVYFYNGSTGSGDAPTVAAAAPTQDAANVISLFSDSYTDVPVDTWRTSWSAADFEDVVIDGSAMKKYTNLTFVGIETVTNQINASGMTNFRFDLWTPNATQFRVKLVDFGPDGAFGTGDETEHEITYESPAQGEWISYDIPLTDFAGLTNTTNIAQLIFAGMPDGAATAFIDNVYFYNDVVVPCESGLTGNVPVGDNYVLVWADEFDASGAVCNENWHHQTQIPTPGGWFNGEEQHYTDRLDNSFVEDGLLNITAKRENFTDQGLTRSYTSARLNSKFAFTYGRVDVRAKLPAGSGTWPAIWMLGREVNEPGGFWFDEFGTTNWPAVGEIDIMEHFGNQNAVIHGTIHTPASFGAPTTTGTINNPTFDTEFHDYSIIWDENEIVFLMDDVPYYVYNPANKSDENWPFYKPQYLLLNVAMGGFSGTIPPEWQEGTMQIDYVRVYQKEFVPPTEPTVAADAPTEDPANVISMFSDEYTDVPVDTWKTVWSDATFEDVTIAGSAMKKYTNLNFVGIETVANQIDASDMTNFRFDLWTPDASQFRVKLVDFGPDGAFGTGDETEHEITFDNPFPGQWNSFDIPLSDFTSLINTTNIAQLIFAAAPAGAATAFIDNVYFYKKLTAPETAAPTPTQDQADVISMFSDEYTDVPVDTWRTSWSVADFEDVTIDGSAMKKYSNLSFVGIETVANQIDASGMDNFHFDYWSPDGETFRVKWVDFGPDGAFGGDDDTEHEIVYENPDQGRWVSFDIPMSAFAGLTNRSNLAQLIFSGNPAGEFTTFIDNIYFYTGPLATPEPATAAPDPTEAPAQVISMFSDVYDDVPVDTWRTSWSVATLEDVLIDGSAMKKYTTLSFVGIETVSNQIDASNMTNFRFDLWSPNATVFRVKLVDFGPDGAFGGGDDNEYELAFDNPEQNEWVSFDIPLSEFIGLASRENIAQLIFSGGPAGFLTAFIDNVYFYDGTADVEAPSIPANLTAANVTDTSFDVNWAASTDNVGVVGYNVYLDGVLQDKVATTSFTFDGLTASTTYEVQVEAYDAAGNTAASDVLSTTTAAPPCSDTLVDLADFEVNDGVWRWNRRSANLVRSKYLANSGKFSVKVKRRIRTTNLDLSSFEDLSISFNFLSFGVKDDGGLILEMSTDGGNTFVEVDRWTVNTDFVNKQRAFVSVDLSGPFSSATRFRLKKRPVRRGGNIFVDDIEISGCSTGGSVNVLTREASDRVEEIKTFDISQLEEVSIYPNPVLETLNIRGVQENSQLELINLSGQVILKATGVNQLDVRDVPDGIYLLRVTNDEEVITLRINKQ